MAWRMISGDWLKDGRGLRENEIWGNGIRTNMGMISWELEMI